MSFRVVFHKYKNIFLIILGIFSLPLVYLCIRFIYDLGVDIGSNLRYLLKFGHFC